VLSYLRAVVGKRLLFSQYSTIIVLLPFGHFSHLAITHHSAKYSSNE